MGIVYLARAEGAAGFVKPVVVKRMLTEMADDAMEKMFVREARILSRLQHPGVVSVLDFGREDGAYLLVMEYVHGYHLGRWNKYVGKVRGPMPAWTAIHITIHVLEALHYAHTRKRPDGEPLGIVHRDVSPSNVFIDAEGHVKLLDFGIARASGDTDEYKTKDTTVKGKLAYLPPEMFQGETPTARTDVYSCGVLLHELLIGKNEFRGHDMSQTLNLVLRHTPTPVCSVRSDVPAQIDDILARALAKHPDGRYADAEQFAQALREVRGLAEDEADSMLGAQVGKDFSGDLAEQLDVPSLEALEDAWRNPPIVDPLISTDPPPPRSRSDHPTTAHAGPPAAPGRSPASKIAVVAVVLVAAVVGGVLALEGEPSAEQPSVVVVQQDRGSAEDDDSSAEESAGDPAGDPAPAPASAGDADAGEPDQAAPTEGERRRTPRGPRKRGGDDLSAALARKAPRIEGCFTRHTQDLSGAPRIAVRFSIDEAGRVRRAELIPGELSGTALGRCLLEVARSTEFGPRDAPATFRIPITARASP